MGGGGGGGGADKIGGNPQKNSIDKKLGNKYIFLLSNIFSLIFFDLSRMATLKNNEILPDIKKVIK